ncbi:pilus assembly protein N-terminal domain-containing protein [Devosia sp.]|uniref:pilus assembly protein N-terminal domain-containing protein n=1 Tax=Devosia sp. TaxID=1871048 RepID=UPI003267A9C4
MSRFSSFALAVLLLAGPTSLAQAAGEGPITVNVNMARILRISAPASTVVVGNPAVADVTIQDPQTLILTGKSYGQTNLIVLDRAGNPIADTMLEVVQLQAGTMTIYQGNKRTSMSCTPVCQPAIMLGDESGYLAESVSNSRMVDSSSN